jgi:hypothetical protein
MLPIFATNNVVAASIPTPLRCHCSRRDNHGEAAWRSGADHDRTGARTNSGQLSRPRRVIADGTTAELQRKRSQWSARPMVRQGSQSSEAVVAGKDPSRETEYRAVVASPH